MTRNNAINTQYPVTQFAYNQTSSVVSLANTWNFDDTIPQQTEGTEVLTVTITPKSATNLLHIQFRSFIAGADYIGCALFQDAGANAICAQAGDALAGYTNMLTLDYMMTAGTTSATTFKIRAGCTAGTGYINATPAGGALFNGTASCSLIILEIVQ